MTVTKEMLKAMRNDIDAALKVVAEKYGLEKLTTGNATFTNGAFTYKLNGQVKGGLTKEQEQYDHMHKYFGLPPRGTKFIRGGKEYAIEWHKPRTNKIVVSTGGKNYLMLIDDVKLYTQGK